MPQTAPKYVRLTQHMVLGCQVDIESGWGISGFDVKEVPDDPAIQAYVKNGLTRGLFEEASLADYEAVQASGFNPLGDDDVPKVIMIDPSKPLPENVLRQLVDQHSQAVRQLVQEREQEVLSGDETTPETVLRTKLSNLGVDSGGSRAQLLSRLKTVEGGATPQNVTETPAPKEYEDMSKKELQAAAKQQGLPASGTADELLERLEAHKQRQAGSQGS